MTTGNEPQVFAHHGATVGAVYDPLRARDLATVAVSSTHESVVVVMVESVVEMRAMDARHLAYLLVAAAAKVERP